MPLKVPARACRRYGASSRDEGGETGAAVGGGARVRPMLWERIAELPLVIEGYSLEKLDGNELYGLDRITTSYRLTGGGVDGVGEDVGLFDEDAQKLHDEGPYLELAGEWTLGSFVEHLATLDQWKVAAPEWEMARAWRNWAFESAALDLALRQAGKTLPAVLGRDV